MICFLLIDNQEKFIKQHLNGSNMVGFSLVFIERLTLFCLRINQLFFALRTRKYVNDL